MRVKIINAPRTSWYRDNIGDTITVEDRDFEFYHVKGVSAPFTPLPLYKLDCEILPDEQPAQPEPFDLERALNGEKFTWNEKPGLYCIIGKSPNGYQSDHGCKYVVEQVDWKGDIFLWRKTAEELSNYTMAPKEPQVVTRWVNVYEGYGHFNTGTTTYESKESAAAKKNNANTNKYIGSFPVQITLNN